MLFIILGCICLLLHSESSESIGFPLYYGLGLLRRSAPHNDKLLPFWTWRSGVKSRSVAETDAVNPFGCSSSFLQLHKLQHLPTHTHKIHTRRQARHIKPQIPLCQRGGSEADGVFDTKHIIYFYRHSPREHRTVMFTLLKRRGDDDVQPSRGGVKKRGWPVKGQPL